MDESINVVHISDADMCNIRPDNTYPGRIGEVFLVIHFLMITKLGTMDSSQYSKNTASFAKSGEYLLDS